jgi:radical SAM protein with 4Fe4S-binding SPASM domain
MSWNKSLIYLAGGIHLKVLEMPCAYNVFSDELYELSPEALDLLSRCDGTRTVEELAPEEDFLAYCLEERVLELRAEPGGRVVREIKVGHNERPSLRYLMMEVTDRCNLRCRHCYLGDAGSSDLDWGKAQLVVDDFGEIGGLRLLVTGGEPLLYPHFKNLNEALKDRSYRAVLITNGTLMEWVEADYTGLNFQEIQFSVDGLEAGHDYLRGKGTYRQVMRSLGMALAAGLDVSVATVIYSHNLDQLEGLGNALRDMGVTSWTLEFPVPEGRMEENREFMPSPAEALPFFDMEWGLGPHESAEGYACGTHLANVEPGGRLIKCGYYRDIGGGDVGGGLRQAWRDLPKMRLEGACVECEALSRCGGGCRYRADLMAGEGGPDPVMCARMGIVWD